MIALIAVILVAVLFYKMVFGYKMRVVGSNPWFAKACGINMTATIICAQLFGGALAGLGGTCEILGNYDRYNWVATTQHGFDGLMVAVLARKEPAPGACGSLPAGVYPYRCGRGKLQGRYPH